MENIKHIRLIDQLGCAITEHMVATF